MHGGEATSSSARSTAHSGRASWSADRFDVLLRGGEVIDGTGRAPVRADVLVDEGRVVHVGARGATAAYFVDDGGGNECSCDGVVEPCRAVSAGLAPPAPLP